MLIAVRHDAFASLNAEKIGAFYNEKHKTKILADLKGMFDKEDFPAPAYAYWRL